MSKAENSKQQIFKAATDLFFRNGFEQTKTKEIAKEAQVSEALLFKYFHSKSNLLNEVIKETMVIFKADSLERILPIVTSKVSFDEKIYQLLIDRHAFILEHHKVLGIIFRQMQTNKHIHEAVTTLIEKQINPMLNQIMSEFCELHGLNDNQRITGAQLFLQQLYDMILHMIFLRIPYDLEGLQARINIILKGLQHE